AIEGIEEDLERVRREVEVARDLHLGLAEHQRQRHFLLLGRGAAIGSCDRRGGAASWLWCHRMASVGTVHPGRRHAAPCSDAAAGEEWLLECWPASLDSRAAGDATKGTGRRGGLSSAVAYNARLRRRMARGNVVRDRRA